MTTTSPPLDVSPQTFLKIRMDGVCKELANAGAASVLVAFLPDKQIIHISGNHQCGTKEYADLVELLGRKLLDHAKDSVPQFKSSLIVTPN